MQPTTVTTPIGPYNFSECSNTVERGGQQYKLSLLVETDSTQPYCFRVEDLKNPDIDYLFFFADRKPQKKGDCVKLGIHRVFYPMDQASFDKYYPLVLAEWKSIAQKAQLSPNQCSITQAIEEIPFLYRKHGQTPHVYPHPKTQQFSQGCIIVESENNDNCRYFLNLKEKVAIKIWPCSHEVYKIFKVEEVPITKVEFDYAFAKVKNQLSHIFEKYGFSEEVKKDFEEALSTFQKEVELKSVRAFIKDWEELGSFYHYPQVILTENNRRYYFYPYQSKFFVESPEGNLSSMKSEDFRHFLAVIESLGKKETFSWVKRLSEIQIEAQEKIRQGKAVKV